MIFLEQLNSLEVEVEGLFNGGRLQLWESEKPVPASDGRFQSGRKLPVYTGKNRWGFVE